MSTTALTKPLEATPHRPEQPVLPPQFCLEMTVNVEVAHLANPQVAVARLLTSEAGAFARVNGDETRLSIAIALENDDPSTLQHAQDWVRWVVHNAGVRGQVSLVEPQTPEG